jgi:imidazolonepropionase-like amidohydrolase
MGTKEQLKEERDKIVTGLEEAYRKLIEYKKQKKSPLIVVRDGKIVAVDPNDALPTISYKRNEGELTIS